MIWRFVVIAALTFALAGCAHYGPYSDYGHGCGQHAWHSGCGGCGNYGYRY